MALFGAITNKDVELGKLKEGRVHPVYKDGNLLFTPIKKGEAPTPGFDFATDEPSKIAANPDKYPIGATRIETFKNGDKYTLIIADKFHDELLTWPREKVGLTICSKFLYKEARRLASSQTNVGGYTATEMKNYLDQTFFDTIMPDNWRPNVKPVVKKYLNGGSDGVTNVTTVSEEELRVWIAARVEMDGTTTSGYRDEGYQYPIFAGIDDYRSKFEGPDTPDRGHWFRSAQTSTNTSFSYVNPSTGGIGSANPAGTTYGFRFFFCV